MSRQLRFKGNGDSAASDANTGSPQSGSPKSDSPKSKTNIVQFDMFAFLRLLFLNRRWLIGATLTAGIITAVVTLFIPNKYTSHAALLPSKSSGGLSALKGITGMSVLDMAGGFGGGGGESSSELFPTTLNSARLRNIILQKNFKFAHDGQDFNLTMQEYLEEDNLDKARIALAKITAVNSEFKTGVITLDVTTKYPVFSAMVGQAYIDELDRFNRTQRKTSATEYENFLFERLDISKTEMASAENALEDFQNVNRDWALSSDPASLKELLILKRDLEIKMKTFALLTQQHELAKSETQKDLPVVQALDAPSIPLLKSAPKRSLTVVFSALIAAVFGIGFIVLRESFNKRTDKGQQSSWNNLQDDISASYPKIAKRLASVDLKTKETSITT